MFSIREMIGSGFLWLFSTCVLPLCLTIPGLCTEIAERADDTPPRSISKSVDTPEVLVPKPPPPPPVY